MSAPTIIIAGLGRCGSSATMQMLHAARVPCVGEPPSFEAPGTSPFDFDYDLFERSRGRAIKILDPHRLPRPLRCEGTKSIFLVRNAKQQALSQIKFATMVGGFPPPDRRHRMHWIASLRAEEPAALKALPAPVVIMNFVELCRNPRAYATRLRAALSPSWHLDVDRMLSVLQPRTAFEACEPGVDIELLLSEAADRAAA